MKKVACALTCWLVFASLATAESLDDPSMLERLEQQEVPYIAQYYWKGGLNDQLTEELFQEYLRMGFTGVHKVDQDAFKGARMFVERGLHGFMWQTYWAHPDPQLDRDGNPLEIWAYGCLSSEQNIAAGTETLLDYIKNNREILYTVGGRYVLNSWDETGLQYAHYCQCEHCQRLFREYLWTEVYKDDSAAQDTNGDGITFNADAGMVYEHWDDIPLPQFEDRFALPVLWKHFVDFTAWKTARFFARIEENVNQAGEPMDYTTFYHSTMFWPGVGPQLGITPYHHAQQSAILVSEFCIADWPVATIAASWNDRLSREYERGVYNYSWFWPGYRAGSEDFFVHEQWEYERALARKMGHALHGLLFWHYILPIYNHLPQQSAEIAYWHHFLQKHWDFLKKAEPSRAQIAVLWPGHSSVFYERIEYPKTDFGWGPQALIEGQYPFTVVQEEEVESGILGDYRLLYVFGVERTTAKVLAEIDKFIARGGYVCTDADSLLMEVDGSRSDLLKRRFGVDPRKKYKSAFWPTVLSPEDAAWAQVVDPLFGDGADEQAGEQAGEQALALAPTPTGLAQVGLDPGDTNTLLLEPHILPTRQVRTYHDVVTGVAAGGKVVGTFGGEPVAVETDRTVWFGNRPGYDIYAVFPRDILAAWGEPLYKNGEAPGWYDSTGAADRSDYRRIVTYLAEKARVRRPAIVTRGGDPAGHIEVAVKQDPKTSGRMIFLVNHEGIGGAHEVLIRNVRSGLEAWDVSNNSMIEADTDGRFTLDLEPWRARVIFVGPPRQAQAVSRQQANLMAVDLSPVRFTFGPKTLAEGPLPEVKGPPTPQEAALDDGEVARLTIRVSNTDPRASRLAEPILIPGDVLVRKLPALSVQGLRLASGEDAQWDDLDKDGVLSSADEIVWQADLAPGEQKTFTLSLHAQPVAAATPPGFALLVSEQDARVQVAGRELFIVGSENSWQFPQARTQRPVKHPGARFFPYGDVEGAAIATLADGPVRKLVEVTNGYQDGDWGAGGQQEREVVTTARYAIYARQVPAESHVYASIVHKVRENFVAGRFSMVGRLAGLAMGTGWYKDTLGRVGPVGGEAVEKNSGGWLAIRQGEDQVLGLLARRTEGIVAPRSEPDERDGLQVVESWLVRSAMDWNGADLANFIDLEIAAGNVFCLQALIILQEGTDWQGIDSLRQQYAEPPLIAIENCVLNEGT